MLENVGDWIRLLQPSFSNMDLNMSNRSGGKPSCIAPTLLSSQHRTKDLSLVTVVTEGPMGELQTP